MKRDENFAAPLSSGLGDALLEEVVERNGVVANEVCDLCMERGKDGFVGGDEGRFVAVASGKVLRGDDTHHFSALGLNEEDLRVVVGEVSALHRLGDE